MWFYRFFRICFFVLILSLIIWCFISLSPDKCNCSSRMVHNMGWAWLGIVCSMPVFLIVYNFPIESLDRMLYFKLFKISKKKYQYIIDEHINVKDNTSKFFPLVKTTYFYPPFYIKKIKKDNYILIDPKNNFFINNNGYDSKAEAIHAVTCVKLNINKNSFKYQYDRWFCSVCPLKKKCYIKKIDPQPLNVKIKKTFNK